MRFRSGRRTNRANSHSENLVGDQHQEPDLIKTEENQVIDSEIPDLSLSAAVPAIKRSVSPSSINGDLKRIPLLKREGNGDSELESDSEPVRLKQEKFIKTEATEENVTEDGDNSDSRTDNSKKNADESSNNDQSFTADELREALAGSGGNNDDPDTLDDEDAPELDPNFTVEDDADETTETDENVENDDDDSDKENSKTRKRSRRNSLRKKEVPVQEPKKVGRAGRNNKRRVSFDTSDTEFSAADESVERKRRGRSAKSFENASRPAKKIKGNGESATKDQCSMLEPSVKVTKEESRANLEAKTKDRPVSNNGEGSSEQTGGQELGEDDTEVLQGTLVVWEGPPHEPLFKKKPAKPGRFYIVNCGEGSKGSSLNRVSSSSGSNNNSSENNNSVANNNNKPPEAPAPSACSCCASGCQFGSHGVITGETSKRVSRRRPKGPKKVQLVTKEEHSKILNSYIEDKKYEPDFKVDSLFANQVDPSQQNPNGSGEGANRRTRLQNKMGGKQGGKGKPNQQDENMEEEQLVSFTVKGNPELVDDVAGYESVDSNALLQKNGEQMMNPELGLQLGQDDFIGLDQRQKRPYRMRKLPSKEIQGEITCDPSGKPRCTYTDLIEKALMQSNGGLTVSEIYNWISTNYPYFQANDDRWKNSVRHNLSINPYFKKGDKARNGAGHLWVISEDGKGIRPPIRRKSGADNILDAICIENGEIIPIRNETDRAISVILSEYAMASMQHQNHNHQEEESPVTYIQIPNDIAIGGGADGGNQVICYEDLPDGSYAIQGTNEQQDQMYTISDFSDGNVIIVNPDESNKENVNGQLMDDVMVSDFSVLASDGGMLTTNGRMSAPPMDTSTALGGSCQGKRERPLSRSSSLPTAASGQPQEIPMDDSTAVGMNGENGGEESSPQELTMLNTVSVGDHETLDAIGIPVPGSQDATQVIEIMGDHLFDAKELGMVYEYDNHGDPLFL